MTLEVDRTDLEAFVRAYDQCWIEGRPQDLRAFLHPDVVFVGPRFERLAEGIDACVQSYVDFLARASVHAFTTSDYGVDEFDDSAVVTYRWTIDYELDGARAIDSGREMFMLVSRAGRWLITWRIQRPERDDPPPPAPGTID